ncbi:MAG: glycosyltransferase family 4 protein [Acidobacteria bacterium]|nr:glycosyltransferase family 4 protein [Acidobacteriota bacterium]
MRIAYLCADRGIPLSGCKGASIHVRAIAQALAQRGHDVQVAAVRDTDGVPGFLPGITPVGFDRSLKDLKESIRDAGGRVLASEAYGLLLNSLCFDTLENIHRQGSIEAVYERYSLWSTAGARFAHKHRIPYVLEVNAPLVGEQRAYRDLALPEVAEGIEAYLFRRADAIFVPSEELRDYIIGRVGLRPRVIAIPNGVDLRLFDEPPDLTGRDRERLENRFVIAFVGSLKPWHGIDSLLVAFERLKSSEPRAHLLVVGAGPLLPRVREEAERLGEDAVTVVGAVPHQQVAAWLRYADVGVAPYPPLEDFYFSPLKVVEYLAAGLPVVASDIGQLPQLVAHEQTGLLVPPGDATALAEALARLCSDAKLRRRMGRRARRRARAHHGWEQVAARVDETLERLRGKYETGHPSAGKTSPVLVSARGSR